MIQLLEIFLLAFTVFCESSGESYQGKLAVASIIKNRVELRQTSYYKEITRSNQFSCYNTYSEFFKHFSRLENKSFKTCLKASIKVYYGKSIFNKVYNYTRLDVNCVWMKKMKIVKIIGNHKFMKGI
jgi:N-acetylmuramoyl-L-alanine amidase